MVSKENQDLASSEPAGQTAPRSEIGTLVRALLVAALMFTLVVALRWAVNVTNANARQISSNLANLSGRYGQDVVGDSSAATHSGSGHKARPASHPAAGPSIDPIESTPGR